MSDTDKQKLENNSGNYINQNHPDPSQDDTGTTKTALSNADESGNNLSSSVRPESHNSQKSPVLIIEHHNNIQGDRISETKSTKSDKKDTTSAAATTISQQSSTSTSTSTTSETMLSTNTPSVATSGSPISLSTQPTIESTQESTSTTPTTTSVPTTSSAKEQTHISNGKDMKNKEGEAKLLTVDGAARTSENTINLSTNSEKNNETCSDDALQKGQQASTNLSLPNFKEDEQLSFIKGAMIEEADDMCEKFRDQGIQCGEDQVNKDRYIPKVLHKFIYTALPLIFATISLVVALYTHFISIPNLKQATTLKIDPNQYQQDRVSIVDILKRLASVEKAVNIKDSENCLKPEAVVHNNDIANFEDRFKKSEQSLIHQVSEKVEKIENLKDQIEKFEKVVTMKFEDISVIKNEQNELKSTLKTNFVTLKEELEKQSKYVEKNNAVVAKEIAQHKEDVHNLNLSVENLGSNMKLITENITGISVENLVLGKRTEDLKENTLDKGSLITVIMIITVLLVVIIIYLVAKKENNRHFIWNVDSIDQGVNDGVNNIPTPYSTAGRILRQVPANPRLEKKLCVISFYEETHPLHMQMTQSVTDVLTIQRVEFVIRRHEDILNIPPVCLLFLFVDFNERNVILEDPTLGLGDLRLTTVQAVQKMGGKLVIFYVRDQNSRQLGSMKLYNEDLVSVTRQRELSDLNQQSRFISAYETLTDFQKTQLKRIVSNDLNML